MLYCWQWEHVFAAMVCTILAPHAHDCPASCHPLAYPCQPKTAAGLRAVRAEQSLTSLEAFRTTRTPWQGRTIAKGHPAASAAAATARLGPALLFGQTCIARRQIPEDIKAAPAKSPGSA